MTQVPQIRAGNADRERAADFLQRAVVEGRLSVDELEQRLESAFAAVTRHDLDRIVVDVRLADAGLPAPGENSPSSELAAPRDRGTRLVVALIGNSKRHGRWRVARRCTVLNVMGSTELDMTEAELSGDVTRVRVWSIMGQARVCAPLGVRVDISKVGVMGGHDIDLGSEPLERDAPILQIQLVSIMGHAEVRRCRGAGRSQPSPL